MVPVVAGLTGLIIVALVPRRGAILAFAAWFTLLNAWVSSEYYGANRPGIRRNMLTVYSRLDTFTTALDPSLGGIKYWFEKETIETPQGPADLGWVFDSFVATRGWGGNLLSQGAPLTLDELRPEHLQIASCVGVLSSQSAHDRVLARFVHAYEQQGQMMRRIRDATFSANHLAVAITILKPVAKDAAAPADGRKPDCLP